MKLSAFVAAGLLAAAVAASWTQTARAAACVNDIDCTANGTACGTDVCSWASTIHTCVAATSGDKGWCTVDTDCKCHDAGATCIGTFCSFVTTDAGAAAESDAAESDAAESDAAGSGASGGGGGGSSGGCSVAFGTGDASSFVDGIGLIGLVCGVALRRRRR
jgi:hypothetical protein